MANLKLYSWNVNGLRAVVKNGFHDFLSTHKPDILCLQEIKIDDTARAKAAFDFSGYVEYWNPAHKRGYSGTGILVKEKLAANVIDYKTGLGKIYNDEGRIQTLEFNNFFLLNIYFPNTRHDLSRLHYKIKFNSDVWSYAKKLEKKKPIIITGDFNVAHQEIDLKNPKENEHNAGFTKEERQSFNSFLDKGFVDTFRYKYPDKIQYSWWSYRFFARRKGIGWRIDYFCVSDNLKNKIQKAQIHDNIYGSDHCPIQLDLAQ